jgi:hypothetical protein
LVVSNSKNLLSQVGSLLLQGLDFVVALVQIVFGCAMRLLQLIDTFPGLL